MSKIIPISDRVRWSSEACVHTALDEVIQPNTPVLVIYTDPEGKVGTYSAQCTNESTLWMLERAKYLLLSL